MFCSNCGAVVREGDKFCVNCGHSLIVPKPPVESVPPIADAVENAGEEITAAVTETEAKASEAVNEAVSDIASAESAAEACEEAVSAAVEAVPEQVKIPEPPVVKPAEPVKVPEPPVVVPAEPVKAPERPVKVKAETVKPPVELDPEDEEPEYEYTRLDKPLSVWGYIWRILLFAIPVLNIIPLFVMAFSSGINKNSKNFASGVLVLMLIGLIIGIGVLVYFLITTDPAVLLDNIRKAVSSLLGT